MIDEKIIFNIRTLKHFIDNALGLSYETNKITGYELLYLLLNSASHNTYLETVSNKSDTLYSNIKSAQKSMTPFSYLNYIKKL